MLVEFGSDLEEFSTIPKHILFALLAQPYLSSLTLYFLPCTSISANLQSLQFHEHVSFVFYVYPYIISSSEMPLSHLSNPVEPGTEEQDFDKKRERFPLSKLCFKSYLLHPPLLA